MNDQNTKKEEKETLLNKIKNLINDIIAINNKKLSSEISKIIFYALEELSYEKLLEIFNKLEELKNNHIENNRSKGKSGTGNKK